MKFIIWNCRGLLKSEGVKQIRILIGRFKPTFIGILESHVNLEKITVVHRLFGNQWNIKVNPAKGRAGDIICLWRNWLGKVDISWISSQACHYTITLNNSFTFIISVIYTSKLEEKKIMGEISKIITLDLPYLQATLIVLLVLIIRR